MVGVCRGGLLAWVLLVLVLGAACVWVVGGSGRATRGWSSAVLVSVLARAPPAELWAMSKARALQVLPWWMVVF